MSEEQRYNMDNMVCNRLNKFSIILHDSHFLRSPSIIPNNLTFLTKPRFSQQINAIQSESWTNDFSSKVQVITIAFTISGGIEKLGTLKIIPDNIVYSCKMMEIVTYHAKNSWCRGEPRNLDHR